MIISTHYLNNNCLKAQYIGDPLDDVSSDDETVGDDVEPEIADALRQSKSPGENKQLTVRFFLLLIHMVLTQMNREKIRSQGLQAFL